MAKLIDIEFPVWYQCNNYCKMCANEIGIRKLKEPSLDKLKELFEIRLKQYDIKDIHKVSITGGEPTLNENLFAFMDYVITRVPQVEFDVISNGRRLIYHDYTEKFSHFKNKINFCIAIHGPSPGIHDKVTSTPDSFTQTVRGIDNLIKLKAKNPNVAIEIRTVVSKLNYKYITEVVNFVTTKWQGAIDRHLIMFTKYKGFSDQYIKEVFVSYAQVYEELLRLYKSGTMVTDFRLYHFPLCTVPLGLWPRTWRTLYDNETRFLSQCDGCPVKDHCLGVLKSYLKYGTEEEFKSVNNINIETSSNIYKPINTVVIAES